MAFLAPKFGPSGELLEDDEEETELMGAEEGVEEDWEGLGVVGADVREDRGAGGGGAAGGEGGGGRKKGEGGRLELRLKNAFENIRRLNKREKDSTHKDEGEALAGEEVTGCREGDTE